MQTVSERWYVIYSRVALVAAVILLGISVWGIVDPHILNFHVHNGDHSLMYLTQGFMLAQILYILFFYKRETQRSSAWESTIFIYLFQLLTIISLVHTTGQFKSFYMVAWYLLVIAGGMFGLYATIGTSFIISLYVVLATATPGGTVKIDPLSLINLFATYTVGILSYLAFKKFYRRESDSKISQLSGALKNKQLQSEILIQSIADGVIVTNAEGKVTTINATAATMVEWPTDEAIGLDVRDIAKLNDEVGQPVDPSINPFGFVLAQKQATSSTYQLEGRAGSKRFVSCVVSPVSAESSEQLVGTVAIIRDVSASKAEEQRRADFISTASHEMRTPVAAIEGYLALALNDRVSKIDVKARSYLEKAHASTQHLGTLFQDLLTSAKAEDGRLVSHPAVIEMGSYLEQLADSLRFAAEKKGLLVEFTIGTSDHANDTSSATKVVKPLYYAHADPDRLREVVTNLFDNAVKYTDKGKISIGLTGNVDVVQFYIRDTGNGIPKEDVPHLFQKFYRVDNSSTRTVGGTGLGLFICAKIIELYKGRIWVDS